MFLHARLVREDPNFTDAPSPALIFFLLCPGPRKRLWALCSLDISRAPKAWPEGPWELGPGFKRVYTGGTSHFAVRPQGALQSSAIQGRHII
jgi:hypothetical protein